MSAKIRTVITNPTASKRFYGYLNPIVGGTLNPGQSKIYDFDLRTRLSESDLTSLERDIKNGKVVYSIQLITQDETGSVIVPTANVVEYGDRAGHKTVITFNNTPVTITYADSTNGAAGNLKIYTFPVGVVRFLGIVSGLTATRGNNNLNANWSGNFAVGTSAITAATQDLASPRGNLVAATAIPAATAGVATVRGFTADTLASKHFDGTVTAVDAFLNFKIPAASFATGANTSILLNGSLSISWQNLGNY
jgi:hypothetical protein